MLFNLDPMIFTKFEWIKHTIQKVAHHTATLFPLVPVGYVLGNHDMLIQGQVPVTWLPFKENEYSFLYEL